MLMAGPIGLVVYLHYTHRLDVLNLQVPRRHEARERRRARQARRRWAGIYPAVPASRCAQDGNRTDLLITS